MNKITNTTPSNLAKITRSIFLFLSDVVYATEVVLSRESVSRKIMRLDPGYREWEIRKSLRQMETIGYVNLTGDSLTVTKKGSERIRFEEIDQLSFDPSLHPWDGKWRLIMFDIPEKIRNIRDILRWKMKEWQCTKLQQSVFVTPYPCDAELNQLIKLLSAQSYVYVIVLPSLGNNLTKILKNKYRIE